MQMLDRFPMPELKTVDGLFSMGPCKAAWSKVADGDIIEISEVAETV